MKKMLSILTMTMLGASWAWSAEYLVKYRNAETFNQLVSISNQSEISVKDTHAKGKYVLVEINEKTKVKTLAKLLRQPGVEYVVPNFKLHAITAPIGVEALKEQWAIAKVQAEKAWQKAGNKGSRKVIVAVIDTGVDYKHKSLAANSISGYDFKANDSDPMDETSAQNPGHGTHCSGIIGATGLVDQGTVGISPEVSIMPLRFLGSDGSGDLNSGIKAIDYAIEKGAQVISASWGAAVSTSEAQPLIDAVKRASDRGVIFVAAAANDGKNNDTTSMYPANAKFENTIAVAASGSSDAKPSWSNYGRAMVDLASPGENIMSTLPKDKYGNLSGTSMATPLVSGLVAFLKAQDMSLTGAQIRALLQTSGAKVKIETACNCRVDAFEAVSYIVDKKLWLTPAAGTFATGTSFKVEAINGAGNLSFTSSAPNVISVDDAGNAKALADGSAVIQVVDSKGQVAKTLDIYVGKSSGGGDPGDPGQPAPGECPLGDQKLCDILCQIMPDMPFCSK